jgi:hypothetical protein
MMEPLRPKVPGAAFPLTRFQNMERLKEVGWFSATPARRAMKLENA